MRRRRIPWRIVWLAVAGLLWIASAQAVAQPATQEAEAAILPMATAIAGIERAEHNVFHRPIELRSCALD